MTHRFARMMFLLTQDSRTRRIVGSLSARLLFKRPVAVRVGRHLLFSRRWDRLVAMVLWKYGLLEKQESRLLRTLVRPGMTVVDIGANIGYYTTLFADWVGAQGRVYAFEPERENFDMLSLAVRQGGITNAVLENAGIGSHTGKHDMYINPIHSGDHRTHESCRFDKKVEIQMMRLDDYFAARQGIHLIKMDIQGGEYFALQGMKNTLVQGKEMALLTQLEPLLLHEAGCSPERFLGEMIELGFSCRVMDRGGVTKPIRAPAEFLHLCDRERSVDALFIKE